MQNKKNTYIFIDAANLFYGGVKSLGWKIDYQKLIRYLIHLIKNKKVGEENIIIIAKHIKRVKFYMKLEKFGYRLRLKPTKVFWNEGKPVKKANCDVDMTLDMVRYMEQYNNALILSGDGDFAPVLLYLIQKKRNICILARGERTAREIRLIARENFRDFSRLRNTLEFNP